MNTKIDYGTSRCADCGTVYLKTGANHKRCSDCGKIETAKVSREASLAYAVRTGRIQSPGVGSGNGVPRGEKHPKYKTGISIFRRYIKDSCEACGALNNLCVHHKDENRNNNVVENLMTLCKKCHQIIHRCWDNFPKDYGMFKCSMCNKECVKRANNTLRCPDCAKKIKVLRRKGIKND